MKLSIKLSSLVLISILAVSCNKQLDQQPTDTYGDANAYRTVSDLQEGTNGVYSTMSAYWNNVYAGALTSDEVRMGSGNSGQGALTYRYQYSDDATTGGDVIAAFGSYYTMIDRANRVMAKIPVVAALNSAEETRKTYLNAQLLALRAMGHFELLNNYAARYTPGDPLGVPIMLESNPLAKPARAKVDDVLSQIEADFSAAKAALPAVTAASFSDTVFNKVNIAGYQARVALWKRDYDAAITYATEVINSAVRPIANPAAFYTIWNETAPENSLPEVLLRRRYGNSADGAIGGSWTTGTGQVYIAASNKAVARYGTGDVRAAAYITTAAQTPNDNGVNKYWESPRGGRVLHLKLMRTAEMYLLRAEARARKATPDLAGAAADINLVRTNRITGYTPVTFADATTAINEIMEERAKELWLEGQRFFDLKRNAMPVQRLASDAAAAWQTLPATSYLFVYPIPRSEMNANSNMVQNPGY